MKILKTDTRLIDEGYRYKIEGDLISEGFIDLMDLDKPLYVTGSIQADGSIKAGGFIEAGEYIQAGGSIKAGGSIQVGRSIEAGGSIKAGRYIKAGGFIEAGWFIKAGGFIEVGEYIQADGFSGISAGLYITATTYISFGLKIFAGICAWRQITDEEKTITCAELRGGGVVEYGILNITEKAKQKVTLELTDEQLEQVKKLIG